MSKWIWSFLSHITSYKSDTGFPGTYLSVTQAFELLSAVILLCLPLFIINHLYWMIKHWYHKVFLLYSGLILKATVSCACMTASLHSICDTIKKHLHQTTSPNKNSVMQILVKRERRLSFILSKYTWSSYSFFSFLTVYTKIIKGCFQLVNYSIAKWRLWRNDIYAFLYDIHLSDALKKWLFMEIFPLFCKYI